MSDAEAVAIHRYLDEGGIVVADSEPGLYDEHCHRRPAVVLHDCLPEKRTAARRIGRGKFVLYSDLPSTYVKARGYGYQGTADPTNGDEARRAATKLRAMLDDQAGLHGNFRLCDDGGRDLDCTATSMDFVDGQARYVACVVPGKYGNTTPARLTITAAGHLYDCRAGKYLGATDGAAPSGVDLRLATGNLFALLPYRMEHLELAAPARAAPGQPIDVKAAVVATAKASSIPFVRHFIVFQLRRPDGRELPEHRWIVETENGVVSARLYLALNDPVGKWTLISRDVATGIRQTEVIEIQGAAVN